MSQHQSQRLCPFILQCVHFGAWPHCLGKTPLSLPTNVPFFSFSSLFIPCLPNFQPTLTTPMLHKKTEREVMRVGGGKKILFCSSESYILIVIFLPIYTITEQKQREQSEQQKEKEGKNRRGQRESPLCLPHPS